MSKVNNGGQAFPFEQVDTRLAGHPTSWRNHGGLTKREYFAAKAMQGLLAGYYRHHTKYERGCIPKEAYAIADAMLEHRNIE